MGYKPHWERIIFLAVLFNFFAMSAISLIFFSSIPKVDEATENLIEIAWADVPETEVDVAASETVQDFPEIKLPPIEIPKIEPTAPPESSVIEKSVETFSETETPAEIKPEENQSKPAENPESKLKVIVKVYPKDLFEQLVASGAIHERVTINGGKIVLAVTIGVDGKVKNAEILHGGGTDDHGTMINLISKIAASSWIFEPYLDEKGNPAEFKTQIEFLSEDF